MAFRLDSLIRRDLTLDPGSVHTTLASRSHGLLHRELSRIALSAPRYSAGSGYTQVIGYGQELVGRQVRQPGVRIASPVERGRLADPQALHLLVENLLKRLRFSTGFSLASALRTALVIPAQLSEAEHARFRDFARDLGGGRPLLVEAPFAAAEGLGLDIGANRGRMLVDIGGGKTAIVLWSLGGLAASGWAPFGGEDVTEALRKFAARRWQIELTWAVAEQAKQVLGSVYPRAQMQNLVVSGTDLRTGFEKKAIVDDNELRDVLIDACEPLVMAIQHTLGEMPAELAGDLEEDGVLLYGGGALLYGLADFLTERIGLPFRLAEDPIHVIIRGAQALLLKSLAGAAAATGT
ncbi:MAG: rod shape-determining protein [SAR324 cluster bacterium]